ncbi:MAG: phosphatidylglycerol lysyltransferase domain-containing protein [Jatrophihabitantaceae bacterium]
MTSLFSREEPGHTSPSRTLSATLLISSRAASERLLESVPRLTALVATALGLVSLVQVLWDHDGRIVVPFALATPESAVADAGVAVCGLLLLRIARGLRRRKRDAWLLAVAACALLSTVNLLHGWWRRPVVIAVTLGLLVLLVAGRSHFTAQADGHSRWFAARACVQVLGIAAGYGLVLLYLPGHVASGVGFSRRLGEVLSSLTGLGGWIPIQDRHYSDVFHATMFLFGLLALSCAVVLALHSSAPAAALNPEDEQRLRWLLRQHGERDSLGYFALRRDKSVVWSCSGKAAITYRVVDGVALASGDPIGDPEAWPGAVAAYRALVERFGWTPAVMGCSELGAKVFHRDYGLSTLILGDEAVLEVDRFALEGRAMRGVRQACTRVRRAGYQIAVRRVAELAAAELDEVRAAAERWRGDAVERGYSMALSRVGDAADPDCAVVTARQDGTLRGVLHFVPWSTNGLSLDLMRRERTADNGLNELMIVELIAACPALGVRYVSLNFAVFRDALERGARIGAGPVLRLWRRILLVASRWWQIDSLYRFNAKFQPRWDPRFVCYPGARDIPRIALAALEAEAFVVRPKRLAQLIGRGR